MSVRASEWRAVADEVAQQLSADNYPVDACLTRMLFAYQHCQGIKPTFATFSGRVFQRLTEIFMARCEQGLSTWETREPLFWVRCERTDQGAEFCPIEKVWRRRRTE